MEVINTILDFGIDVAVVLIGIGIAIWCIRGIIAFYKWLFK